MLSKWIYNLNPYKHLLASTEVKDDMGMKDCETEYMEMTLEPYSYGKHFLTQENKKNK